MNGPSYYDFGDGFGGMKYARCGRSGVRLPLISLGLWNNFGGVDSFENGRAMVRKAYELGIRHFDLANNYGPPPGSAEENFGRILRADLASRRDELFVSTKAGYLMWPGPFGEWGSRKYLLSSLDQSLKRMGLEYVDLFYSHRPDPETPLEETMGALDAAVRSGKALYVGISSYGVEETRRALAILRGLGTPCLIHQPYYHMFSRGIEGGLLDLLEAEGVGSIAFCPLAQGVLTEKYLRGVPAGSRLAKGAGFIKESEVSGGNLSCLRELKALAEARGQSLPQMALAWALRGGRVTSALIGASRPEQIEENAKAIHRLDFAEAELAEIDRITSRAAW
jgi:L-glyceraldehyde 3-phosphate reductase